MGEPALRRSCRGGRERARTFARLALTAFIALVAVEPAVAQSAIDSARASRQMFEAVLRNDLDALKRSLSAGADPHSRNTRGATAAEVAVELGHIDLANYLLGAGNGGTGTAAAITEPLAALKPPSPPVLDDTALQNGHPSRTDAAEPKTAPTLQEKMAAAARMEKPAPPSRPKRATPATVPDAAPIPPAAPEAPTASRRTITEAKSRSKAAVNDEKAPAAADESTPFARYFRPLTGESTPSAVAAAPTQVAALPVSPIPAAPSDALPVDTPPAPRISTRFTAPEPQGASPGPTGLPIVGTVRDAAELAPLPTDQHSARPEAVSPAGDAPPAPPATASPAEPAGNFFKSLGARLGLGSDDAASPSGAPRNEDGPKTAPNSVAANTNPTGEEPGAGGPASRFLRRLGSATSAAADGTEAPATASVASTPDGAMPPPPPVAPSATDPPAPLSAQEPAEKVVPRETDAPTIGGFFRDLGSRLGLVGEEPRAPAGPAPTALAALATAPADSPPESADGVPELALPQAPAAAPPAPPPAEHALTAPEAKPSATEMPSQSEQRGSASQTPPATEDRDPAPRPQQERHGALVEPEMAPSLPPPHRSIASEQVPTPEALPVPMQSSAGRREETPSNTNFFRDLGSRLGLGGNEAQAPSAPPDTAPSPAVAAERPKPPAPVAAPAPPPPPSPDSGPAARFLSRVGNLVGLGGERPDPANSPADPVLSQQPKPLPAPTSAPSPAPVAQPSPQPSDDWKPQKAVVPPQLPPQRLAALLPREPEPAIEPVPMPEPEVAPAPSPPPAPMETAEPTTPAAPAAAPPPPTSSPTDTASPVERAPPSPPSSPAAAKSPPPSPPTAATSQVPSPSRETTQPEKRPDSFLKRLTRRLGSDPDTKPASDAKAATKQARDPDPMPDEPEASRNVFQWLAEMMSGRDLRRTRRLPPPEMIEEALNEEAAKAVMPKPEGAPNPWSAKIDRGPDAPLSTASPTDAPIEQAMAPTGAAQEPPAETTGSGPAPTTLFGLPGAAARPARAPAGTTAAPGAPGGLFGLSALATPDSEGGAPAGGGTPAAPAEGGGLFGLPAPSSAPKAAAATPGAPSTDAAPSGGLWDPKIDAPDKRPDVAAPPKEPPLPESVPTGRGFMLGRSLALGKEPPLRVDAASGTKTCVDKSAGAIVFCLEPPNWPKAAEAAFRVDTILYTGLMAIVRYDGGAASRMQTLFPSDQFDKVVTYFAGLYGRPNEYWTRSIAPLAQARTENPTRIWHARNPANGQVTTLEIRKFDDSRGGFPDTRRGVVMVYVQNANAIFPQVSTLELMRLKRQR